MRVNYKEKRGQVRAVEEQPTKCLSTKSRLIFQLNYHLEREKIQSVIHYAFQQALDPILRVAVASPLSSF